MKSDLFENKRSTIPKSDARVVRIDFECGDMGNRKAHMRTADKGKNDNSIQHVKGA